MIARVAGNLTEISDTDLRLRAQLQITTGFDERSVARDRNAQDAERRAGALERKRRGWVAVPNVCCQASDARGVSVMPFAMR